MTHVARGSFLASVVLLIAGGTARADEPRQSASQAFAEADAAYARGDFHAAALAYELAARIQPHATSMLAASDAWMRAGMPREAIEACDRAAALPGIAVAEQEDARACVERLQRVIATIDLDGAMSFVLRVDGTQVETGSRLRLNPGPHVVLVEDRTSDARTSARVVPAAGERCVVHISTSQHREAPGAAAWVSFAAAAAALVPATWAGVNLVDTASAQRRSQSMVDRFNGVYVPVFDVSAALFLLAAGAGGYLLVTRPVVRRLVVATTCAPISAASLGTSASSICVRGVVPCLSVAHALGGRLDASSVGFRSSPIILTPPRGRLALRDDVSPRETFSAAPSGGQSRPPRDLVHLAPPTARGSTFADGPDPWGSAQRSWGE